MPKGHTQLSLSLQDQTGLRIVVTELYFGVNAGMGPSPGLVSEWALLGETGE